ncbi:MAG: hypothetical protein ACRC2T_17585, partial [Thermoguttaceae bacterium]
MNEEKNDLCCNPDPFEKEIRDEQKMCASMGFSPKEINFFLRHSGLYLAFGITLIVLGTVAFFLPLLTTFLAIAALGVVLLVAG